MNHTEQRLYDRVKEILAEGKIARFHNERDGSWKDVSSSALSHGGVLVAFRTSPNANSSRVWLGYDYSIVPRERKDDDPVS